MSANIIAQAKIEKGAMVRVLRISPDQVGKIICKQMVSPAR